MSSKSPPNIVTLVLLAGIGALSMNIFLPSLPALAEHFETDYATVQLAISAYLGVIGALQLVIGPLSDRYGRRPVMLSALAIFCVATLGCLFAPSIEVFLAFRALQAAIAAGIVLSRAIVRDMVPDDQAASMIGYVTMGMSLVPMVGPIAGGWLDATFRWEASFIALFLFGLGVFLLAYADQGETNKNPSANFTEQFRAYPELLRARRFWGYSLTAAFASGAYFAFLGGAPFVASEILNLSSAEVGTWFAGPAIGYMIGNYLSGRYTRRVGMNRMMLAGGIVATFGTLVALSLFAAGVYHPISLFGPIALIGVGNGMTLPSANAGIVSVRPKLAGSASGLGGTLMIGGGAVLAALTGFFLTQDSGPWPLLIVMFVASSLSIVSTLYVILRARTVAAESAQKANAT
ncbi:MAG: multidrug effflux MFS transporter [Pseudomonadota bacterium]